MEDPKETEQRLIRQAFAEIWNNPYYTPTKPVSQRYRIQIYSILTGIAIAAGMFADHEWLFVGIVIMIKGFDILIFRLRHGWHWRLSDKYVIAAGAVITYLDYTYSSKNWSWQALYYFFITLGVIYPVLNMLELWLMKLRCRQTEEATVVDYLDSRLLRLPGAGLTVTAHYCPIYRIWRDGQETYICDEWFTKSFQYERDENVTIRIHRRRDTEIYEKKRVRAFFKQKWKAWLIYDVILLTVWISPQLLLLDLALFAFCADRYYKKKGEE
ncbi:MAG: hypothetical protein IK130_07095 [Oscillospiraceae bacterium]|nr:hypothetical protein [Oscillospiraceae bacterium]